MNTKGQRAPTLLELKGYVFDTQRKLNAVLQEIDRREQEQNTTPPEDDQAPAEDAARRGEEGNGQHKIGETDG